MTTTVRESLIPIDRLKRGPDAREKTVKVADSRAEIDVRGLWKRLRETVDGEVRFDHGSRGLYAQDGSNYYHVPIGVVLPKSVEDVVAVLAACREFDAPVFSRTGGTSLAGQACNEAVLMDFSKYMRRIVEIDAKNRIARVEPGVICDELSNAVKPYDLTWGPKPATHSRCGFGGMLSNNCGGMNAQYAGIAVHNVEALDVVLYDGRRLHLGWMTHQELELAIAKDDENSSIYAELRDLRDRYASRIRDGYPKIPRRVSGYNLDELLPKNDGRFNLARAIVGTEGTCVTIVEATIRLVDLRPKRVVVQIGFPTVFDAADHIGSVLAIEPDPMAIEGMDQRLYDHIAKKKAPSSKYLDLMPEGHGWLSVQIGSDSSKESLMRAEKLAAAMKPLATSTRILDKDEDQEHLWTLREGGLGATAFVPGEKDTWEGWEDSAVPPEKLGDYLRDLDALYQKHGYSSVLYGHFGQGLVHCRVNFELTSEPGIENFHSFLEEASDLCAKKYGGSLSGEHGDGQSKAEFLRKMFGPELVRAFGEFKAIWDPKGKMNPGKIVRPHRPDEDLRLGPGYAPHQPKTHFKFPNDKGSFARATLRCVGIGKCRNTTSESGDVMCPSFMVTEEEKHSTRGRAHLLWEMLRGGQGPIDGNFRDEAVKESLDLCLACKGCKGDCPVNVDVATYKAEFLSHYYEGRIRPRSNFAFGLIDKWARLASIAPSFVNALTQAPGLSALAKLVAGVHSKRTIPQFATETFRAWFDARKGARTSPKKVLLWVDTFTENFHPETARAAVKVLEHAGFEVAIPARPVCCGRPLYDFGMLDTAKRYLDDTLACLEPQITAGTPMVVLEPSCASVFRDEMIELLPNRNEAKNLSKQTFTLSEFLDKNVPKEEIPKLHRKAIVQTHCHHHAVMRFDAEKAIFDAMELETDILKSGCCGMAGSFGFEKEKYDVAQACGERLLLPRVKNEEADTLILADGFSCKTQISQNGPRRGLHLAEALAMAIDFGEKGPTEGPYAESAIVLPAQQAIDRGRQRAFVALLVLFAVVVALVIFLALRG
ncbi:MAG: FAD-binding and (Fe-S)-binding domain-containing protein [Polyangiaceae bacterium]